MHIAEELKQEFIHLLSFVERDGVQKLLEWLESTDFYTAPASTKYHGAYAGGLLEHSLNVFRRLVRRCPAADMDTLTITALLHDVCKIHLYEKTEDGYRHNEQFPIGHGEKSVILILRHMPLTDEEITAISSKESNGSRPQRLPLRAEPPEGGQKPNGRELDTGRT